MQLVSFYLLSICDDFGITLVKWEDAAGIWTTSVYQYVCYRVLYSYPINTEYTYIHAAVAIYVLEGTPPECIYQVDAADPENAELNVSCVKEKNPEMI